MMRRSLMGVALCFALSSSACASSASSPSGPINPGYTLLPKPPSTPTSCEGPAEDQSRTCVGWGGVGQIIVVTWGSSTCPTVAKSATQTGAQAVTVELMATGGPSCTADSGPSASTVGSPSGITSSQPVTVTVGKLSIVLPPRST